MKQISKVCLREWYFFTFSVPVHIGLNQADSQELLVISNGLALVNLWLDVLIDWSERRLGKVSRALHLFDE